MAFKLPKLVGENEDYSQKLDDQWRRLPFTRFSSDIIEETEPNKFWAKVGIFNESGETESEYYLLFKFSLEVLSLPHSNADSERLFNKISRVKTKSKNKLITETVAATLGTNELISNSSDTKGFCSTFKPPSSMLSRITTTYLFTDKDKLEDNFKF